MVGIYFSGTGNTKHCTEKLVHLLDEQARIISVEDDGAVEAIKDNEIIVFAYPVQFSNIPMAVRDFINNNHNIWKGKQIICMATMGAFSGDGGGCSARLFKKYGAEIIGGLHIRMPDSVCDVKLLKKTLENNKQIVTAAGNKIVTTAANIKEGKFPKEGLGFAHHIAGLLGQRLWFYSKTQHYSDRLKINETCVACGLCIKLCPMKNIKMCDERIASGNKCTMCYRCISQCPQKAITLLGKKVHEQCRFERYI